jgi:hypothetical protein
MEGFIDLMFAPSLHQKLRGALRAAGAFWRKGRL